jgi:hypothetical protein
LERGPVLSLDEGGSTFLVRKEWSARGRFSRRRERGEAAFWVKSTSLVRVGSLREPVRVGRGASGGVRRVVVVVFGRGGRRVTLAWSGPFAVVCTRDQVGPGFLRFVLRLSTVEREFVGVIEGGRVGRRRELQEELESVW